MIKIFEKVIRKEMAKSLAESDFPLNYLKMSTVTSGTGLNDKVIFLVFKKGARLPFVCIKTVRNYEAKGAILRNFNNLQVLNKITLGSPYETLFSRAICLYDEGEVIFSIETACLGSPMGQSRNKLAVAVKQYILFQEFLVSQKEKRMWSIKELAQETFERSVLSKSEKLRANDYFLKLLTTDVLFPKIIQHGDMTPDNILFSKSGVCIVDYDDVGNTSIPGFDLYSLFRRFSRKDFSMLCNEYLPAYFKKIGVMFDIKNYRSLLFLYNFIEYTQKKGHNNEDISIEDLILGFERLYPLV